ncbi:MAG: hypothetical protein RBQ71_04870 [Acholeplasmataceae bacterium]|nr:hypothetical protein [Acholeplasmataceae bacterium]
MTFSIHELKELTTLEFTYDFSNHLKHIPDMLSIEPANITSNITWLDHELIMDVHIDVNMMLACSITMKPVPYEMHMDAEIIFGDTEDCDYLLTDPIELTDILFGYIVSEKPFTIYHPDADKTSFEKERSPHPAFADLDKTFKK